MPSRHTYSCTSVRGRETFRVCCVHARDKMKWWHSASASRAHTNERNGEKVRKNNIKLAVNKHYINRLKFDIVTSLENHNKVISIEWSEHFRTHLVSAVAE